MWFPQKERALATGIFNSGTSVGVMVSWRHRVDCRMHWGWQGAFVFIGVIGLVWLYFWQKYFDAPEHQQARSARRSSTTSGPASRPPRRRSRFRGPRCCGIAKSGRS